MFHAPPRRGWGVQLGEFLRAITSTSPLFGFFFMQARWQFCFSPGMLTTALSPTGARRRDENRNVGKRCTIRNGHLLRHHPGMIVAFLNDRLSVPGAAGDRR